MERPAINVWRGLIFILIFTLAALLTACGGGADTTEEAPADPPATTQKDSTSESSDTEETTETEQAIETEQTSNTAQTADTEGHELFMTYCAKCHGPEGLGNGPSVGSLSTQAGMNLTLLQDTTDEEILTTISQGKGSEMPPWGLILPLEEREELAKHVRAMSSQ